MNMSSKSGKSSSLTSSSSSSSPSSASTPVEKLEPKTKIDPSFKSKRYRDKLRTEVKALEALLPVDRTALSRKLDSQTVFRLVIALLRIKGYFQAVGQSVEPADSYPVHSTGHVCEATNSDDEDEDDITKLLRAPACFQVLEGFLLVLTADGTILYVSDNVLQYLGYNQVDLMHRCLYSVVHPDDMADLKMVLETSLGHLVTHYDQQGVQDSSHHIEECNLGTSDISKPLSVICRMRCFSGSSVGYLKMHCSGKMMHHANLPKSKRSSSNVVLLFCNPFMLRATEFTTDLQKNVFWSKHDLDLNVKEVDKKGTDIVGFDTEELEKRSFYTLIHPEDLTAVASCHKMLVESSEVQTVYFRMQTKGGDWVWLTSRGKVISKNSKKFSIAFSHCPLREEDSTYIQQEAILRRRYAISDLMCAAHLRQSVPGLQSLNPATNNNKNEHQRCSTPKSKKTEYQTPRYHPYSFDGVSGSGSRNGGGGGDGGGGGGKSADSKKDSEIGLMDASCILEVSCPSAWHAMTDRHSPVLPSGHVAHKISQREKQLQFQEFCRRQQMEGGGHGNQSKLNNTWDGRHPYSVSPNNANMRTSCTVGQDLLHPGSNGPIVNGNIAVTSNTAFYPNDPSFGSCVDYGFSSAQASNSAAAFVHHWYSSSGPVSGERLVSQSPSASCLTPNRSPHQCAAGVSHPMQAVPSQNPSFHPVPRPYGTSVAMQQNMPVSAYSSMPPSPPPSPPAMGNATVRPVPPFQHALGVGNEYVHAGSVHQQQYYRPEWVSASWQPYFPYTAQPPPQLPPPPYPRSCNVSMSTASSVSVSSITDLQKATEKFLPMKKERDCEKNETVSSVHEENQARGLYGEANHFNVSNRWGGRAAWTFNGQVDVSWTASPTTQPYFRHVFGNGSANLEPSINKDSDVSATVVCRPQGFQDSHALNGQNLFHASSAIQPPHQGMSYPYSTFHPHLGSPPTYPYGVYPAQLGYQGGHSMNTFYATPSVSVKASADFSRPVPERSLDLPSIGSFLEYLNEV